MTEKQFNLQIYAHQGALRNFALKFTCDLDDANDLFQETMIKAIRFFEHYQQGTNLKGWLFVIMKNTFINGYRKEAKKREMITQEEEISSNNLMVSATSNGAIGSFAIADIKKALALLPEVHSYPFIRYVEGYKYEEIAQELGVPLGTVKTRIHQARESLKKHLEIYRERPAI